VGISQKKAEHVAVLPDEEHGVLVDEGRDPEAGLASMTP
jgi:hypothetical protein